MTIDISVLQSLPEIAGTPVGLRPKTCSKTACTGTDHKTCAQTIVQ